MIYSTYWYWYGVLYVITVRIDLCQQLGGRAREIFERITLESYSTVPVWYFGNCTVPYRTTEFHNHFLGNSLLDATLRSRILNSIGKQIAFRKKQDKHYFEMMFNLAVSGFCLVAGTICPKQTRGVFWRHASTEVLRPFLLIVLLIASFRAI